MDQEKEHTAQESLEELEQAGDVQPAEQCAEVRSAEQSPVEPRSDESKQPDEAGGEELSVEERQAQSRLEKWLHLERSTWATQMLVSCNIGVFLAMVLLTGWQSILFPDLENLMSWGALYGPDALYGEYWRMFTSMFLHAGILHLGMNMYVLWFVGQIVERLFGAKKFLVIYLLAGIGGAINMLIWCPTAVSVGASGAVFGAFGGLLAFFQLHRSEFPPRLFQERLRGILVFLLINLFYGFLIPGIGNAAHIGGLVAGYIAGVSVMPAVPSDLRWHWRDWLRVAVVIAVFSLLFYVDKRGYLDYSAELSLGKALKLIREEKFQQAVTLIDRRLQVNANDVRALTARAAAYNALNEHKKAIADCDRILGVDPKSFRAYLARAGSYGKLGDHQRSLEDIGKVLSLKPNLADAYAMRGWDHLALERFPSAIDDYTKALQLSPSMTWAYSSRAFAKFAVGDRKGAIEDDRKFLSAVGWKDEHSPFAVILCALAYRSMGDADRALATLREGDARLSHSAWPYPVVEYLLGEISAEKLKGLATDNDKMTEAQAYLGLDLAIAGKAEDAKKCFEWVSEHGNKEFFEYLLARAELRRAESGLRGG